MKLEVSRKSIPEALDLLRKGHWQVPKFQREFVWSQTQVFELLRSVFKPRPIGMITLWNQPQEKPHCESESIRLRTEAFKEFAKNPAVLQLVLDGRQRLTTLAIAFGGLRAPDDRHLFSGRWFVDIDKFPQHDDFIVYKKRKEIEKEHLDTNAVCLSRALIPLDKYADLSFFNQNINNAELYPEGQFPGRRERELRANSLKEMYETFLGFQIPVAELPDKISLAEVCDIFDVLNTTGTKVSTFDLIHNLCFSDSNGEFDLRSTFQAYQEELDAFGMFCDSNRPEFFCQAVTACYLLEESPKSRTHQAVLTIKGGDLVGTPFQFYDQFVSRIDKVDTYTADLFGAVLGGEFRARDIPYPVSVLHYIALRWKAERMPANERYQTDEVDRIVRAFFWRNALTQRYDQGFLSLFAADLKELDRILLDGVLKRDHKGTWTNFVSTALDDLFGAQFKRLDQDRIKELLLDGDIRGALRQAISLFIRSRVPHDLIDGSPLDRTSGSKNDTQLHHIYARKWCKDNRAEHNELSSDQDLPNAFANLVPLSSKSNNQWKTKSPATALKAIDMSKREVVDRFSRAFIDPECLQSLQRQSPEPGIFWNRRAGLIAAEIHKLQLV